ncbi:MAG: bifunctional riboflavin kinase/FMN adenylyltransferase, partial [Synechococcus sp. SB0668_bin_13]|nr:bifunctional riboflavin kinase/FMN adenylyltransferase [Synechococcus sp. SB0668_bin_13]MYK86584.1 bifunctional riboflavin kinase/FMN adenylyltransferase [Synechococcus sp. SB0669_bin_7]
LQVNGRKFLPREGVYACWVRVGEEGPFAGVMNLGPQPTADPAAPSAVEVHLLDRTLTLNGLELEVEPVRFLRSQQTFQDLDHLSAQIGKDAQQARQVLLSQVVG